MPYPVQNLIEGREFPVCVSPADRVQRALDLMIEHDFSQLPVITESQVAVGMVTHQSILRALSNFRVRIDELRVSSAIVKADKYHPEDDLFDLLDRLRDTYSVLIVDSQDKLVGIVTTYDSTDYFRRRAEDLMLVEDIETMVKDLVLTAFTKDYGEPNESMLTAAIDEITSSGSALKKRYSQALRQYLKLTGTEKPDIQPPSLEESFQHLAPKEEAKRFDDLTLYEYAELLLHKKRWHVYKEALELDPDAIRKLLDDVRTTRNILAHFKGEVSATQRDQLRFCRDWLTQHQMGIPVASPASGQVGQPQQTIRHETPTAQEVVQSPLDEIRPVEDEPRPGESRYAPLAIYLQGTPSRVDRVELSFEQIEQIIGNSLPPSAYSHRSWWSNDSVGHVQSQQWLDVGWRVASINMTSQLIRFARIEERERWYIDFYGALYAMLETRAEFPLKNNALSGVSWFVVSDAPHEGRPIGTFGYSFARANRFRVELYIDTGDREANKQIYDSLFAQRKNIEAAFGTPLSWERLDDRRASRVTMYFPGSITDSPEKLSDLRTQALAAMIGFEQVLRKPVMQARDSTFPG